MSRYDASSDYPPATSPPARPTPSTSTRSVPLRVNTGLSSTPSASRGLGGSAQSPARSDFRGPGKMYDLPSSLESPKFAGGPGSSAASVASGAGPSRVRPGGASARPGGLAAIASMENGRYRGQPRPASTRRGSSETSVAPSVRRGSDNALPQPRGLRANPPPVRSPPPAGSSIYSGREGSMYGGRIEGVTSPTPGDLQLFAHHCRLFYFSPNPPPDSASFISSTLAALPANHRAAYTRLQSSLRSLAHLHHLRLRISSFHALISSITSSGSLTPPARSDLVSARARTERREQFGRFIATWCTSSAGGVEPFFRGLWSVLRAQSRGDESRGGAGASRVVWEIDDAVFLESGGTEFMHECVTTLKGVLGFDDQPLTSPPKLRRIRTLPRRFSASQARRGVPNGAPGPRAPASSSGSSSTYHPVESTGTYHPVEELATVKSDNRSRASSDPFLDPGMRRPTTAPVPQGQRSTSGRGPAPPPPPSRRRVSENKDASPDPLQSRSDSSIDLAAPYPSSQAGSPLLPMGRERSSSTVQVLEDAAENVGLLTNSLVNPLSRPDLPGRVSSETAPRTDPSAGRVVHTVFEGNEDDSDPEPTEDDIAAEEIELNRPRFRLWTFPQHINDEEAESLMALFPAFIRRGKTGKAKDVRFPFVRPGRRINDLEAGGYASNGWDKVVVGEGTEEALVYVPKVDVEDDLGVVRSGTGRMWVGVETRRMGWAGGGWFKFKRWWRRLFGMG